jgi:hypothetical protein
VLDREQLGQAGATPADTRLQRSLWHAAYASSILIGEALCCYEQKGLALLGRKLVKCTLEVSIVETRLLLGRTGHLVRVAPVHVLDLAPLGTML